MVMMMMCCDDDDTLWWLWPTVMMLIFYKTKGRVFLVSGFSCYRGVYPLDLVQRTKIENVWIQLFSWTIFFLCGAYFRRTAVTWGPLYSSQNSTPWKMKIYCVESEWVSNWVLVSKWLILDLNNLNSLDSLHSLHSLNSFHSLHGLYSFHSLHNLYSFHSLCNSTVWTFSTVSTVFTSEYSASSTFFFCDKCCYSALWQSGQNRVWIGQLWQIISLWIFNENEPNFDGWCMNT